MNVKRLNPILNVSNLAESFAWFEKFGWTKGFDWGEPPTFGSVCSGDCEVFLCQGAQGASGRSALNAARGGQSPEAQSEDSADQGVWLSIWVDNVDAIYLQCLARGLDVTWPPTDEPWNVREMRVRHPDGHVFRVSEPIE